MGNMHNYPTDSSVPHLDEGEDLLVEEHRGEIDISALGRVDTATIARLREDNNNEFERRAGKEN
jgi:ABC-type transporter Mla MlaB component